MPSSTWTCPPGVTSVMVECWGAGSVASAPGLGSGSGGGGGGYSRSLVPVIPGNVYNVQWALGDNNPPTQTGFDVTCAANTCIASSTGAGILTAVGNQAMFGGGNGALGNFTDGDHTFPSGGGGGSGGRSGNGFNAVGPAPGGSGGEGGSGGIGGTPGPPSVNPSCGTNGTPGQNPGGGGGGSGWSIFCPTIMAQNGGAGGIWIWNMTGHVAGDFPVVATDPLNIVGSFGFPPTPPPPLPQPKKAKRAFVM